MPNSSRRRRSAGGYAPRAVQLLNAQSQIATCPSSSVLVMPPTGDFSVAGWVKIRSGINFANVLTKSGNASNDEWFVFETFSAGNAALVWYISTNGVAAQQVSSGTIPGAVGNWVFFGAYFDGANLGLSVNGGAFLTQALGGTPFQGTGRFTLGSSDGGGAPFDGLIDSLGIWRSAHGGGGALTLTQFQTLYNNGAGLRYARLPPALGTNLVAWWDFSNNWNDVVGGNTLTGVNGASFVPGLD